MNGTNRRRTPLVVAGVVFIVAACLVVYIPALYAGFVWEDDLYVVQNPLLSAPDGLLRIWIPKKLPAQYFPMVYTTFRFEHSLWGLKPFGYHLTNIVLHIINALLLWWLLSRLNIRGAWIVSAIFALHPVQVESVAWITQRKNVLSLLFYLGSALSYVQYAFGPRDGPSEKRAETFYMVSIVLFLCALASKTVTCTLPVALLIVCWWKRGHIRWTDVRDLARFFVLGLAWGLYIMWWEHGLQGTELTKLGLTPIKRILVASRGLWFYVGKLVCPVNLTISYPPWNIDATNPLQYGWLLLSLIAAWCMWHWRGKLGRGPVAAIAFFVVTLSPMLGFILQYTFVYTYVADHYQYMAGIGLITLFVAVGCRAADQFGKRGKAIAMALVVLVLAALGTLTWHQSHIYKNEETLWRDTIRKNPDSYLAHNNLGIFLSKQGKFDQAIDHFTESLRLKPGHVLALCNLGNVFFQQGKFDEAVANYSKVLRMDPNMVKANYNMGVILAKQGKTNEATKAFRKTLEIDPDHTKARDALQALLESAD